MGHCCASRWCSVIRCSAGTHRRLFKCNRHSGNLLMHDKRRVVITGMGALSALGATTRELWNGLLANRSGVRCVQRLVDSGITVTTGGEVDAVSSEKVDRDHEIANRAIDDALVESKREAVAC